MVQLFKSRNALYSIIMTHLSYVYMDANCLNPDSHVTCLFYLIILLPIFDSLRWVHSWALIACLIVLIKGNVLQLTLLERWNRLFNGKALLKDWQDV